MRRSVLLICSLLLLSGIFFLLRDEKEKGIDIRHEGTSFIEGLKIVNRKNGVMDWTLYAKRADITDNGEKAHLSDLTMEIEDKSVKIRAGKGVYVMKNRNLTIDGGIIAEGSDYSIISEHADYDGMTGNLSSAGNVRIEGKKFRVQGTGLSVDNAAQRVRIQKNVQATFFN